VAGVRGEHVMVVVGRVRVAEEENGLGHMMVVVGVGVGVEGALLQIGVSCFSRVCWVGVAERVLKEVHR